MNLKYSLRLRRPPPRGLDQSHATAIYFETNPIATAANSLALAVIPIGG